MVPGFSGPPVGATSRGQGKSPVHATQSLLRALRAVPITLAFVPFLIPADASGGEVDVLRVDIDCDAQRRCRIAALVRHADTGWDHFANRWEVLDQDGRVLATRVLRHPHVEEQPFLRSLEGVVIPQAVQRIVVRAHDSVHRLGGAEVEVAVPSAAPEATP